MTEPRWSTVFDYSNLRLHPDGTRVYQKSTNLAPRIAKVAVCTSRKNWIAKDAGGLLNVGRFKHNKKPRRDLQGDEEYISLGNGIKSPEPEDERKIKRKDERPAKRRKYLQDHDYIEKDRSTSANLASDTGTDSFPYEPSSVRPSFSTFGHNFLV